jgi:very-short-patch-repair endonuclease
MRDRKADNLVRKQLWLEQCAWANRQVLTPSEARLWSALCSRKLGVQFRREVPLAGRYIVDFCAPSVRLVVEVDGACHVSRGRADARRDAVLRGLGYRVLRLEAVLARRTRGMSRRQGGWQASRQVFGVASRTAQTRLLGLLVDGQEVTGCSSPGIPGILATETGGSGQPIAAANGA